MTIEIPDKIVPLYRLTMYWYRLTESVANWLPFRMPADGITILGTTYEEEQAEMFVRDFGSRISFTYRRDFTPLDDQFQPTDGSPTSRFVSDAGWGCTIRAAQSLLAECLIARIHGYKRSFTPLDQGTTDVIAKFADRPEAPLSIHRFIDRGQEMFGKRIPEWYGPTSAAQVFGRLFAEQPEDVDGVKMVVFGDGTIYLDQMQQTLQEAPNGVIIAVSVRLSLTVFDESRYKSTLLALFQNKYFRGIAGGEGISAAYYFPAASNDNLYYLDPHLLVQQAMQTPEQAGNVVTQDWVLRMSWRRLNPSMTLGFFVANQEEWLELVDGLKQLPVGIFEFMHGRPPWERRLQEVEEDGIVFVE